MKWPPTRAGMMHTVYMISKSNDRIMMKEGAYVCARACEWVRVVFSSVVAFLSPFVRGMKFKLNSAVLPPRARESPVAVVIAAAR